MKITKKKVFIGLICVALTIPLVIYGVSAYKKQIPPEEKYFSLEGQEYVPDEIIVKFTRGYEPDKLERQIEEREMYEQSALGQIIIARENTEDTLLALPSLEKRHEMVQEMFQELQVTGYEKAVSGGDAEMERFYVLEFPPRSDLSKKQEALSQYEAIEFIEANNIVELFQVAEPNDPFYSDMWGLEKINASEGWQTTTGSKSVTVAVVDTGVDRSHTDLSQNILNGGIDTVNKDNNPQDDHGHGTHVSGTIGALTNNSAGVAGVNWNVNILPVKVCDAKGGCSERTISDGLTYAADRGVNVVNMSLGSNAPCSQSGLIRNAVQYALGKNITIVAAAGNGGNDKAGDDASSVSPASCNGVITVSAVDRNSRRPAYANFGNMVDVAAPGGSGTTLATGIVSTIPGNQYSAISGTSMASPHVAGVAALLLSLDPDLRPSEVEKCIVDGGTAISTDRDIGPLLNLQGAINACQLEDEPTQVPPTDTPESPTPTDVTNPAPTGPQTTPPAGTSPTTIEGTVFEDSNRNKRKDTGESGIQGASLLLTKGNDNRSAVTNTSGRFSFPNLERGTYTLSISLNGARIWELDLDITDEYSYYEIPIFNIPNTQQPTNTPDGEVVLPSPIGGERPDTAPSTSPTPTPTPLIFYECQPATSSRTINGKQLRISYLECTRKEG